MLCAATKLLVAQRAINKSICAAAQKSNALDRLSDTTCALAIRTPKRSLSISENAIVSRSVTTAIVYSSPSSDPLVSRGVLRHQGLADYVAGTVHHSKMHSRQILAHDPQREQLCTREKRNNGGEKRKPGYASAVHKIPSQNIDKNSNPKKSKEKPDQAGKLERQRTEAGHHVGRMSYKLAKRISRRPYFSRIVTHRFKRRTVRSPCQQHVNRNKRSLIMSESPSNFGAKNTERANSPGDLSAHDVLQSQLGYP